MIHLEGREASKAVKSCDTCKHDEAFGCPSFIHDRCENYSEWEQADRDIITALCSLPKIQSSDGQDYVQLFDVLETVRRYLGDCISKTEAIKTIQQHGVGCFDVDDFTPEQCERYVIKLLQDLKPSVAIPNKTGHWVSDEIQGEIDGQIVKAFICSECGAISVFRMTGGEIVNGDLCPNCGVKMVEEQGGKVEE